MRYRRLAGGLLLWAVVPLPFLYIVLPPFWLTAVAVGLIVVLRPSLSVRLSPAVQNLLGVAILMAVIAAGGVRVGPLRPLGQLLLLLASVRTLLVVDRRSFLRVLPALFLAWLVSLTASTHIAALLYFVVSAALWWWVGMELHLLGLGEQIGRPAPPPVRPVHAAGAAVVAVMLAVPIFVVMPRLRSPWIAGRGGAQSVTGFSSRVELGGVGTIRQSQEEALIVRAPGGQQILEEWTRLRATAYERVTVDAWAPRRADRVAPVDDGMVWLHERYRQLADAVELKIELKRPREFLFVPIGAIALKTEEPIRIDPAGGVALAREGDSPLIYTVWVSRDRPPRFHDLPVASGPRFKPPEQVRRLAEQITVGLSGPAERAAAIERYLRTRYEYSLQGMARIGPDPVSWFLLQSRRGHCEYFAGGMVVLLEALEIPARMVGGYSGGTVSPDGSEVVIREANAHTWVEVWIGRDQGWQPYDPTPDAGVPGLGRSDPRMRIRFAWEWIQAGWDRYVLTYGLGEQLQLLAVVGESLDTALRSVRLRRLALLAASIVAIAIVLRYVGGRRGRPLRFRRPQRTPAASGVELLVRRLRRVGIHVPSGATPRWIGRTAGSRWPPAAGDIDELVRLAELELYAPSDPPRHQGRRLWTLVRRQLRAAGSSVEA